MRLPISIGRPNGTGNGNGFGPQIRNAMFCSTIDMPKPTITMPMPATV